MAEAKEETTVPLPPAVLSLALSLWMGSFREAEQHAMAATIARGRGGSTGMDVPMYHRVEAVVVTLDALTPIAEILDASTADEAERLRAGILRFYVAWGPHLPPSWREHFQELLGDDVPFLGGRGMRPRATEESRAECLTRSESYNVKLRAVLKKMPEWVDVDYAPHVVCSWGCEAHPEDHPENAHNTGCEYAAVRNLPTYPPVEREADDA